MRAESPTPVCLVADEYPPDPGGVGRSVARIAHALVGDDFRPAVVVLEDRVREPLVETEWDGGVEVVRNPLRLSATPAEHTLPPPALGEHTDEVLREVGLDSDAIAQLRARGVL